jgi:alkanesulfonate monooxygenase SsuD/methylene tetrahydromethanopterin reductase-like flavin-dependent oxidoreductase (luciferase family)
MTLEFGMWDSFERQAGISSAVQYEQRISLVQEAEKLKFYGYHLAEHHLSPLSMAPSPLLFLSAVSQRTSTIRIGSMVTILPLYPPVRFVQEVCMLDALSNGRLELGVGRGIRDAEHEWFGFEAANSSERFRAILDQLRSALLTGKIEVEDLNGTHYLPLYHETTQQPLPRLWYVGNMEFAAENGMSVLARRPTRDEVELFWTNYERGRSDGSPFHQGESPMVGATRPVFVASTDKEAEKVALRAWEVLGEHFWATETRSGGRTLPRGAAAGSFGGGTLQNALDNGDVLYGSPKRVAAVLADFLRDAGPRFNYLVSSFQWGDIRHDEAMTSIGLFARDVMPVLRAAHAKLS